MSECFCDTFKCQAHLQNRD